MAAAFLLALGVRVI
uniref:Uncharacterized protein n=1 Tax=Arundo donax TaxID=35708 RepID=A0A0A9AHI6_ARUDO